MFPLANWIFPVSPASWNRWERDVNSTEQLDQNDGIFILFSAVSLHNIQFSLLGPAVVNKVCGPYRLQQSRPLAETCDFRLVLNLKAYPVPNANKLSRILDAGDTLRKLFRNLHFQSFPSRLDKSLPVLSRRL